MQITVIGGGGVRAPLFVSSALLRAAIIHLEEVCLMDIRSDKLEIMIAISHQIGRMMESPVKITHTSDSAAALDGASHVVTAIRVGDEGKVLGPAKNLSTVRRLSRFPPAPPGQVWIIQRFRCESDTSPLPGNGCKPS